MTAVSDQLRLFPRSRPLTERFGRQFFRQIPAEPGVYFMHGAGRLLYVGKAGNLRKRVGSYRYVNERHSRRLLRLVHTVESISWEITDTEPKARLRENELLRTLRPKFNRANTFPQAYPYFELRQSNADLTLRLTTEPNADCFGAFKGNARASFAALLRLLWSHTYGHSYESLPRPLLLERAPKEWTFPKVDSWRAALHHFLSGAGRALLDELGQTREEPSAFHQQFRSADMEILELFFLRGPVRNRSLLESRRETGPTLKPEQVDDWPLLLQLRPGDGETG